MYLRLHFYVFVQLFAISRTEVKKYLEMHL